MFVMSFSLFAYIAGYNFGCNFGCNFEGYRQNPLTPYRIRGGLARNLQQNNVLGTAHGQSFTMSIDHILPSPPRMQMHAERFRPKSGFSLS